MYLLSFISTVEISSQTKLNSNPSSISKYLRSTLYTSRKPLQPLLATGVPSCKEPGSAHEQTCKISREELPQPIKQRRDELTKRNFFVSVCSKKSYMFFTDFALWAVYVIELACMCVCLWSVRLMSIPHAFFRPLLGPEITRSFSSPLISQPSLYSSLPPPPPLTQTCWSSPRGALKTRRCPGLDS